MVVSREWDKPAPAACGRHPSHRLGGSFNLPSNGETRRLSPGGLDFGDGGDDGVEAFLIFEEHLLREPEDFCGGTVGGGAGGDFVDGGGAEEIGEERWMAGDLVSGT
ncbi:MAG: hypothetical protein U0232_21400 [Thermomicrobiales bacterium]